MLKEQSKEEIKSLIVETVGTALDEVLDELFKSMLFLSEEKKEEPKEESKEEPKEEPPARRTRRTAAELKDTIMKCWNKGEKNAYQIAQETGISYKTVRNYIPISKED